MTGGVATAFLTKKSSSIWSLLCLRPTQATTGSKTRSVGGIRRCSFVSFSFVDFPLPSRQVFLANPTAPASASSSNDFSSVLAQRRARQTRQTRRAGAPVNDESIAPEAQPPLPPPQALGPPSEAQGSGPATQHWPSPPEGPDGGPTPMPLAHGPPVHLPPPEGPDGSSAPLPSARQPPVQPLSSKGPGGGPTPLPSVQQPQVQPPSSEGPDSGPTSPPPLQQLPPRRLPTFTPYRSATPGPSSLPQQRASKRRRRR